MDLRSHLPERFRRDADTPAQDPDHAELVAHAERLNAGTVRGRETRRVRLRKRIVAEQRQVTVTVEREELVVDYLDEAGAPVGERVLDDARTLQGRQGDTTVRTGVDPAAELVLYGEEIQVVKRVVPVERVRAFVDQVTVRRAVTDQVSHEVIEVEGDTAYRPLERDAHATTSVGADLTSSGTHAARTEHGVGGTESVAGDVDHPLEREPRR